MGSLAAASTGSISYTTTHLMQIHITNGKPNCWVVGSLTRGWVGLMVAHCFT